MQTTAGCAALLGTTVPDDARVVAHLRAAGGIILGKANLSEWASMRASYYSEAYSSGGVQNRNPYNLAEHPGGSSSGSASAVAANMCAFSIGTETDGSVTFPADRNSVVGIKPTVGLTSTSGVIPEAPSLDTVGGFGRSVADVTAVLDIIADKSTVPTDFHGNFSVTYTAQLAKKHALEGARFGLPSKRGWDAASRNNDHEFKYKALGDVASQIERAGAQILEVDFSSAEEIVSPDSWDWEYGKGVSGSRVSEFEVVKVEFYQGLKKYLATLLKNNQRILSLEDLIAFNIKKNEKRRRNSQDTLSVADWLRQLRQMHRVKRSGRENTF